MVETNFKHTEIGLIPHDWEVKTLGEICDVRDGTHDSPKYVKSGYPLVTSKNLTNGVIDFANIQYISKVDYDKINERSKADIGDVLYAMIGTIGNPVLITKEPDFAIKNVALFKDIKKVCQAYIRYFFDSTYTIKRIMEDASGSNQKFIPLGYFRNMPIPLPPTLAEQERIAGALSSIDILIGALNEQIEKKRHIKQGTMQQLLTGKKRLAGFTGEWKNVRLGDVLAYEQPTKYLVQSTEYTELGIPVLTAGKTFILGYTIEDSGIFDKLPVIIFDDFVVESKYVTFPFKVKSSAMKMLSLRDATNNLRFIYEKMQCIDFPIADHKRHWISEYSQIEITIPDPAEQSAIAAVLSGMDTEIAALEQKRDKYIAIKSGMMQDLLTGKIRLV